MAGVEIENRRSFQFISRLMVWSCWFISLGYLLLSPLWFGTIRQNLFATGLLIFTFLQINRLLLQWKPDLGMKIAVLPVRLACFALLACLLYFVTTGDGDRWSEIGVWLLPFVFFIEWRLAGWRPALLVTGLAWFLPVPVMLVFFWRFQDRLPGDEGRTLGWDPGFWSVIMLCVAAICYLVSFSDTYVWPLAVLILVLAWPLVFFQVRQVPRCHDGVDDGTRRRDTLSLGIAGLLAAFCLLLTHALCIQYLMFNGDHFTRADSIGSLETADRFFPGDDRILFLKAQSRQRQGAVDSALAMLDQARSPQIREERNTFLAQAGRYREWLRTMPDWRHLAEETDDIKHLIINRDYPQILCFAITEDSQSGQRSMCGQDKKQPLSPVRNIRYMISGKIRNDAEGKPAGLEFQYTVEVELPGAQDAYVLLEVAPGQGINIPALKRFHGQQNDYLLYEASGDTLFWSGVETTDENPNRVGDQCRLYYSRGSRVNDMAGDSLPADVTVVVEGNLPCFLATNNMFDGNVVDCRQAAQTCRSTVNPWLLWVCPVQEPYVAGGEGRPLLFWGWPQADVPALAQQLRSDERRLTELFTAPANGTHHVFLLPLPFENLSGFAFRNAICMGSQTLHREFFWVGIEPYSVEMIPSSSWSETLHHEKTHHVFPFAMKGNVAYSFYLEGITEWVANRLVAAKPVRSLVDLDALQEYRGLLKGGLFHDADDWRERSATVDYHGGKCLLLALEVRFGRARVLAVLQDLLRDPPETAPGYYQRLQSWFHLRDGGLEESLLRLERLVAAE